jgi:8-oxo-dGTP pyrophosphatase MutT (NUDIX family)
MLSFARMARISAALPADDGYAGVTHAGIALVALDSGRVFLTKRADDPEDAPDVRETWEFPGGGLKQDEHPFAGAVRETIEETGWGIPDDSTVDGGWRSDDGVYQGFRVTTAAEFPTEGWTKTTEVCDIGWFDRAAVQSLSEIGALRPEVRDQTDWDMIFGSVSGNEEDTMPESLAAAAQTDTAVEEPAYTPGDFDLDAPIPVHGVVAPEEMASGDQRAFAAGAMTRRPLRLPFSDQKVSISGHDGSVVVGSVDRLMRKDGLVHWEGALMPTPEADDLAGRMQFFDGKFGVSVDGDKGSLDHERTEATETLWFDAVRAAGLTAVAIPAFHEAYVAFGTHPEMPSDEALTAAAHDSGDLIGARAHTFDRGPGWVTDPVETRRIHDYWTKKGEEGYAKIGWGTSGDFTRAKKLIGAKIAEHSPDKMRFLNQIIAQWHFDALGYWPGDLGKPGNAPDTPENRRRAAVHASLDEDLDPDEMADRINGLERDDIEPVDHDESESVWEAVLVSSVSGNRVLPPIDYFHQHESMKDDPWAAPSAALVVEEPDAQGFRRAWGYAGEWGVCHVGMDGQCVEPPETGSDDYPEFHLGRTKVDGGYVYTGVLTYGVSHRDAKTILAESPEQAMFDNIKNAWAAVRVGENERGIWFSGVVLPKVDEDDLVKIEASGQVSGEWKRGAMRACLTVNVPGFPNERASAEYDEDGNVLALAASAFGSVDNGTSGSECDPEPTPLERIQALATIDAELRIAEVKREWGES